MPEPDHVRQAFDLAEVVFQVSVGAFVLPAFVEAYYFGGFCGADVFQ